MVVRSVSSSTPKACVGARVFAGCFERPDFGVVGAGAGKYALPPPFLNPYDPAIRKAEEKLAELIAGYADPAIVSHAISERFPIIFSTNAFHSWLLTSELKGGDLTDELPFVGGTISARKELPVNNVTVVTIPATNRGRELLMHHAVDTAVHELTHIYGPVRATDTTALGKAIVKDQVYLQSFRESLQEALGDETLDAPTREQMQKLMHAYNDIAYNLVVFIAAEPICNPEQKKDQLAWLKYKKHVQEHYSTDKQKFEVVPARIAEMKHKYGAFNDNTGPESQPLVRAAAFHFQENQPHRESQRVDDPA
jgi:hypothetical protein